MNRSVVLGFIAATFMLSGCVSNGPIGEASNVQVAELSSLPAPALTDVADLNSIGDQLRPYDVVEITVFGVEELSRRLRVAGDGTLTYPFVGEVYAAGLSPQSVGRAIADGLADGYVRNPEVTVTAVERPGRTITVGGEVQLPGEYPVLGTTTLQRAVALARGTSTVADDEEVLISRTVGGQRYIGVYNLAAIQRGNYDDPVVYPNDVITVSTDPLRVLLGNVSQITSTVTSPLILLERVAR